MRSIGLVIATGASALLLSSTGASASIITWTFKDLPGVSNNETGVNFGYTGGGASLASGGQSLTMNVGGSVITATPWYFNMNALPGSTGNGTSYTFAYSPATQGQPGAFLSGGNDALAAGNASKGYINLNANGIGICDAATATQCDQSNSIDNSGRIDSKGRFDVLELTLPSADWKTISLLLTEIDNSDDTLLVKYTTGTSSVTQLTRQIWEEALLLAPPPSPTPGGGNGHPYDVIFNPQVQTINLFISGGSPLDGNCKTSGGRTPVTTCGFTSNTDFRVADFVGQIKDVTTTPVPEPMTIGLLGVGLLGLGATRRLRSRG